MFGIKALRREIERLRQENTDLIKLEFKLHGLLDSHRGTIEKLVQLKVLQEKRIQQLTEEQMKLSNLAQQNVDRMRIMVDHANAADNLLMGLRGKHGGILDKADLTAIDMHFLNTVEKPA